MSVHFLFPCVCVTFWYCVWKGKICMAYPMGACLFLLCMMYHSSPLDGMWVHCKVKSLQNFIRVHWSFASTHLYSLVERDTGGGNVFHPRTQQNDQVSNLDSPPRVQRTNLLVIGFPTILSVAYMYFTTTTTSTPSSVLSMHAFKISPVLPFFDVFFVYIISKLYDFSCNLV